jgi:hypothetical protein
LQHYAWVRFVNFASSSKVLWYDLLQQATWNRTWSNLECFRFYYIPWTFAAVLFLISSSLVRAIYSNGNR